MSELGNRIRELRKGRSQSEFAAQARLSLRTICKLEAGESVRLKTLQQVLKALHLPESVRLELILLWLKLELGDDFSKLEIRVREPAANTLRESDHLLGQLQVALAELPRKFQEQLLVTTQRPEILRCLLHLNDLYDTLRRAKSRAASSSET